MNPLEVPELRKHILTYVVKDKYDAELKKDMKMFVDTLITQNWFKYCQCQQCTIAAHEYFMNIGF